MRYQQPQAGAPLDKSNPLFRGLTFVLNSAAGIIDSVDFNTSTGDTTTGILSGVGQGGEYLRASNNTATRRRNFTGLTTTAAYTVASVVIDSTGRGFIRNPLDSDTSSSPNRKFQLRFNTSNFAEFIAFNTTPSAFTATGSIASGGTDPSVLVGVVGEDKVARVYLNGVAGGTSTITGTVATLAGGNLGICGTLSAATQNFLGEIYLTAIWNRALTAGEVAAFSANPWQLFKGTRYIFPSAAAGNSQALAITLDDVTASITQTATHAQSLAITLDDVTSTVNQTAIHSQSMAITLDSVNSSASQTLTHAQSLAITLDSAAVAINQSVQGNSQALAITLDDVVPSISQTVVHDQTLALALDGIAVTINQSSNHVDVVPVKTGGDDVPRAEYWEKRKPRKKQDAKLEQIIRQAYRGLSVEPPADAVVEAIKQEIRPKFDASQYIAQQQIIERILAIQNEIDDEEILLLFA